MTLPKKKQKKISSWPSIPVPSSPFSTFFDLKFLLPKAKPFFLPAHGHFRHGQQSMLKKCYIWLVGQYPNWLMIVCCTITTYASQSATHSLCGPTALQYWFQDMTQMTSRFIAQILSSCGIRFRPLGFPAVNITPKMKVQLENPCHGCPCLKNLKKPNSNRATEKKKKTLTFHYTGCLIGILMMVFCNPRITG